jgi:hypothetical protein
MDIIVQELFHGYGESRRGVPGMGCGMVWWIDVTT